MTLKDDLVTLIDREHWRAIRGKAVNGEEIYTANAIINMVQDALLSDDALNAAGDAISADCGGDWSDPAPIVAKRAITAALEVIRK